MFMLDPVLAVVVPAVVVPPLVEVVVPTVTPVVAVGFVVAVDEEDPPTPPDEVVAAEPPQPTTNEIAKPRDARRVITALLVAHEATNIHRREAIDLTRRLRMASLREGRGRKV
jgi:hypothetical protein